ncbi:MAG: serine hydrolase [Bacteroidales bacterium]|nr:serine hydrolase [Bacteroidales bacterium]
MRKFIALSLAGLAMSVGQCLAQDVITDCFGPTAIDRWVDSVYNSLTLEQRVAQLICMRANQPDKPYDPNVAKYIKQYNIGGVCFFRNDLTAQVEQTNAWQEMAQTPLMVSIDAEWGLAMRLKNTIAYPYQMTLGAITDNDLIYSMGQQIAEQCHRMGIHVNFAPVVDVNSNPANPIIGMRSFGEEPQKVGEKGAAYALGMQSKGLITTMKHFPGHGNTATDSHLTLPTVTRTLDEVQDIELAPFRYLVNKANGIMVGHLYFPAIEKVKNTSSSLSYGVVTELLKEQMGYKGLIFTDGLDMKGVSEKIRQDSVPYAAFMAGNDVLILPTNVPSAIRTIKEAAERDLQAAARLEESCKKILRYKFIAGLYRYKPVSTENLTSDLKKKEYVDLRQQLYDASVTMLRNDGQVIPLANNKKIAVVTIGNTKNDVYNGLSDKGLNVRSFVVEKDNIASKSKEWLTALESYDLVVVSIEKTNMFANKNYGINSATVDFFNRLVAQNDVILNLFACPYALDLFRINNSVKGLVVAYQDEVPAVNAVVKLLSGEMEAMGTLPVSTNKFKCGDGIVTTAPVKKEQIIPWKEESKSGPVMQTNTEPKSDTKSSHDVSVFPLPTGNMPNKYAARLDSTAISGIGQGAYPGCQIIALKDGKVVYDKCFGNFTYGGGHKVQPDDLYDIASCTKIFASTLAVMKLYDQGKLDLNKTLADFFPYLKGKAHGNLKLLDIMTHQAGLKAWVPFYKVTVDANGPKPEFYTDEIDEQHNVRVAENLYLINDYADRIFDSVSKTPLGKTKYLYSDMGFYYIPKIVKLLTNQNIEEFLEQEYYYPMGLNHIGYKPLEHFTRDQIAPTENDTLFRRQLVWGDVHDQAAAMMGGVAGHAGLFSNARDLAVIMQMLLDEGVYNGRRYLKAETVRYFTKAPYAASNDNRRGIGFDKLPIGKKGSCTASKSGSMQGYGHTGFTGTFAWADPANKTVIIFLSNRVYPNAEPNRLVKSGIRSILHDILYEAYPVE